MAALSPRPNPSKIRRFREYVARKNPYICMEATGCYSEGVAEFFHELGFKVSVVNPLQIKAFRNSKLIRRKTDSVDAQIIVEFCLLNNPALWKPKSPDSKDAIFLPTIWDQIRQNIGVLR